jgi:hypothetical protein
MSGMRTMVLLLLGIGFLPGIQAAKPTLEIPPTVLVEKYKFGSIQATGEFKFLRWFPPKTLDIIPCADEVSKSLKFTGPPGKHVLRAVASNDEGITDIIESVITISGDTTPVDPKPIDPVDPISNDKYDGVHLVMVEEQKSRTKETIKLIDQFPTWRKTVGVKSLTVYDVPVDTGNIDIRLKSYIDVASTVNSGKWENPVILVLAPKGKTLDKILLSQFDIGSVKKWVK